MDAERKWRRHRRACKICSLPELSWCGYGRQLFDACIRAKANTAAFRERMRKVRK